METADETKICPLIFLKNDWFQKGKDCIAVHLYVKDVTSCHVDFNEESCRVFFETKNEQFLRIHGPKTENKRDLTFSYSLHTSGKIQPEQCTNSVSNTRIELKLVKAVPANWVSLETRAAITDRKKTSDITKESQLSKDSSSEEPRNDHISSHIESNKSNSDPLNSKNLALDDDSRKVAPAPSEMKSRAFPGPVRLSESMMLLGGKSTPFAKKSNEQDNKVEKETAVPIEPQAAAVVRESNSLKNMNKTITGLIGLENYANNCYMNVVIQVLANIPEIRDYFADDQQFLNCLSTNNPMSSGGKVAKAFADVIKALWSGRKEPVRPQDLKSIMGKRCSSFRDWQQCDAQEFFSTLLDNLHEDVNLGLRSEKSNECSYKEDDGPSVSEKADTAWNEHFKKHNSLIVKLFHGQMVSRLTCQGCHKRSTTYEPYGQISLPIVMSRIRLQVTVFFRDHTKLPERLRLQISSPRSQIWHLLNILERHIGIPAHCLRACHENKGSFAPVLDDDVSLSTFRNPKHVVVCEIKDEKEMDFISLPFKQHVINSSKVNNCAQCSRSQVETEAKLKRCTRCWYVAYCSRDCQSEHWSTHQRDCRKGFREAIGLPFFVTIRKQKLNFDELVSAALYYANFSVGFPEKESESSEGESDEKKSAKLETTANFVSKQSEKFFRMTSASDGEQDEKKQGIKVEGAANFCSKPVENTVKPRDVDKDDKQTRAEGASNIPINSSSDIFIKAYFKPEQDPVSVTSDDFKLETILTATYLTIEWHSDAVRERDSKELNTPFRGVQGFPLDDEALLGERCGIEECFSLFLEPDRLSEKDGWKCPKCKTVQAVKKELALSCLPPILLVHFKRFVFSTYGQKISKGINYPTSGLDLSHFIADETKNLLSVHPVFDLIGVICHKGVLGFGHYTCMVRCLNKQGQTDIGWRHFDDNNVTKIDEESVSDLSAYVLVYRMRSTSQALKTDSPFTVSPFQVNEGRHERLQTMGRAPNRQLSTEVDCNNATKSPQIDHGVAKSISRHSQKKPDADLRYVGNTSRAGYGEGASNETTNHESYAEEVPEDSYPLANAEDPHYQGLSGQKVGPVESERDQAEFPGNTNESSKSVSDAENSEDEKFDGVPAANSDGGQDFDEPGATEVAVPQFTPGKCDSSGDEDVLEQSNLSCCTEELAGTTDQSETEDEEQFFLAYDCLKLSDFTEVTENDLD